jgi:hypothetical protein
VVVAYPRLIEATVGLPSLYYARSDSLLQLLGTVSRGKFGALKPLVQSLGFGLATTGLWMLPLVLLGLPRWIGASTPRGRVAVVSGAALVALASTALLSRLGLLMPLGDAGNVLIDLGTGIRTIGGRVPTAPRWFWWGVTALSAFGALGVLLILARVVQDLAGRLRRGQWWSTWPTVLLLGTAALLYAPASLNYGAWFDRYTLPIIPLLGIVGLAVPAPVRTATRPRWSRAARVAAASALAALYAGFAVASTHDYLAWNRQRWAAGRGLVASGVSPSEVDGGFEFNNYLAQYREPVRSGSTSRATVTMKPDPRFTLAFDDRPDLDRVRELPVRSWMPLAPSSVLVLERRASSPTSPAGLGAEGDRRRRVGTPREAEAVGAGGHARSGGDP